MSNPKPFSLTLELSEEQIEKLIGPNAFVDWSLLPEDDLVRYFVQRTGLCCVGPTLEFVRNYCASAEEILRSRGIGFSVNEVEFEDMPEDGMHRWQRTVLPRNFENAQKVQ
jgi:hypothetical protein